MMYDPTSWWFWLEVALSVCMYFAVFKAGQHRGRKSGYDEGSKDEREYWQKEAINVGAAEYRCNPKYGNVNLFWFADDDDNFPRVHTDEEDDE